MLVEEEIGTFVEAHELAVKLDEDVTLPFGVVMDIVPDVDATFAVICVGLSTVYELTATLPIVTLDAPIKFVPVIVVVVLFEQPNVGVNEVIVGAAQVPEYPTEKAKPPPTVEPSELN